jgi:hypothetical protein
MISVWRTTPDRVDYVRELVRSAKSFAGHSLTGGSGWNSHLHSCYLSRAGANISDSASTELVEPLTLDTAASLRRSPRQLGQCAEIEPCWRYGSVIWLRCRSVSWSTPDFVVHSEHRSDLHGLKLTDLFEIIKANLFQCLPLS